MWEKKFTVHFWKLLVGQLKVMDIDCTCLLYQGLGWPEFLHSFLLCMNNIYLFFDNFFLKSPMSMNIACLLLWNTKAISRIGIKNYITYPKYSQIHFLTGTLGSGHLKNYKKKVGMTQHVLVRVPVRKCIWMCLGYVVEFLMLIWRMTFVLHKSKQA